MVAGAVYDPLRDELFTAERGAGAHLNGRRLRVSSRDRAAAAPARHRLSLRPARRPHESCALFNRFIGEARAIRRDGAAALDLCYVAAGRVDGFWEEKLQPWDMMAGILFIEEAGGRATRFDGTPISLAPTRSWRPGPLHALMLDVLGRQTTNVPGVAKLADARDLKSRAARAACGFDSHLRHTRSEKD